MPPQAPTSFIPKKPLETTGRFKEPGGMGFLLLISLFIFIASVVGAAGVFGYQTITKNSIASKSDSLQKAEGAFDLSTVQDLIRMDARINSANTLLASHVAPSAIFAFLSQQTLQNVQFTSFTYTLSSDNAANIVLSGIADNFSTVALQSDQFGASKVLKDVVFSSIKNGTGNSVTFSVSATLDASLINFGKNLGNPNSVPDMSNAAINQQPTAPAATTTTKTTTH
jgi:hypothetical protein